MTKRELRKIYLAQQKAFTAEKRAAESLKICERFFAAFDLDAIEFLHSFLPIEKFGEINTRLILEKIWRDFPQIKTLVPRVNFQTGEIENLLFTQSVELSANQWQISEPIGGELVESVRIDAVLVPLLCFDERGFRVGYGKGFYDKFLINCRADCVKIGLSYFPPVEKIQDAQTFDVRLDYCITPERVFSFV